MALEKLLVVVGVVAVVVGVGVVTVGVGVGLGVVLWKSLVVPERGETPLVAESVDTANGMAPFEGFFCFCFFEIDVSSSVCEPAK